MNKNGIENIREKNNLNVVNDDKKKILKIKL